MGETPYEIEQHIRETRDNLTDNFSELEEKVKTAVDWRAQFEERPGTMLALAFGGGVLLSALFPPGPPSHRSFLEDIDHAPSYRDVPGTPNPRPILAEEEDRPQRQSAGGNGHWDAIKGAFVAVAADRLSGFVNDLLPGFKQELTAAQNRRRSERSGSNTSGASGWEDINRPRTRFADE